MQEWVSIYATNECDIGTPDIHRFLQVDGRIGVSQVHHIQR